MVSWSGGACWWKSLPHDGQTRAGEGYHVLPERSVVELIRAVHEKGASFRFMASGNSMCPSIRDGDVITLSPLRSIPPIPGEVVAFLKPETGKLIAHRITAVVNGAFRIQGDNNPEPDGIVPASRLLGVITRVERGGRDVFWPDRFRHRVASRLYFGYYMPVANTTRSWKNKTLRLPGRIQGTGVYRMLARGFFNLVCRKAITSIEVSFASPRPLVRAGGCDGTADTPGLQEWVSHCLAITARVKGRQAGQMKLLASPPGCPYRAWRLVDARVRFRYRGCGLEEDMLRTAAKSLLPGGTAPIMINLPAGSPVASIWARGAGFRPVQAVRPRVSGCNGVAGRVLFEWPLGVVTS